MNYFVGFLIITIGITISLIGSQLNKHDARLDKLEAASTCAQQAAARHFKGRLIGQCDTVYIIDKHGIDTIAK